MNLVNLEQNSDAWLSWRQTGIGSSDAPSILELSPWKTRRELWEEKVYHYHRRNPVLSSKQLQAIFAKMKEKELQNESSKNRGRKLEPVAREHYEWWLGHKIDPVCGVHPQFEFLKVSLDGWNEEKKLFGEIKCPNQMAHNQALMGQVPQYYVPQLLHQFLTSGAKEGHYISFHDKFPPGQRLAIVQVNENTVHEAMSLQATLAQSIKYVEYEFTAFWNSVKDATFLPLEREYIPEI